MVVPDMIPHLSWHAHGVTDRGRRRHRNEDALLIAPDLGLYAVADGMGGHAAGNVASRLAVDSLRRTFSAGRPPAAAAAADRLVTAFATANEAILSHAAADRSCAGMGTTMTAVAVPASEPVCVIAHVGDSRSYRLRDGAFTQLTRDHTWVQQQVDAGMLTPAAARHHARASVLYRVLGIEGSEPADVITADVLPGDVILLCSDGLTTMLEDEEVRQALMRMTDPVATAAELVAEANRKGGVDNITVALLRASASS